MPKRKSLEMLNFYLEQLDIKQYFSMPIAPMCEIFQFEKDEFIIQTGEPSAYLYFLVSGRIRFFSTSENGKQIPYGYSKKHRILGEVSSLFQKKPSISLQAATTCTTVAISLVKYREVLMDDNRFLRYICNQLGDNISNSGHNLINLLSKPIETRLCAFILQNLNGDIFSVSVQETSEMIAASYRHTLRILKNLTEKGYLKKLGTSYRVIDIHALEELSGVLFQFFL